MADLKISELSALAGANLAAVDQLAIADSSASETKRITVTDLVGNATTLIADATIPGAKILFSAGDVSTSALADGSVTTAKLADDAVTAVKIADESTVDLVTTLPGSGAFVGQIALDTTDNTGYIWNGGSWVSFKAAGSVNAVVGDTSGIVNLNVSTVGDQVTITTTLDNTTAARQFLAGPTGAGGTVGYRQIVSGDIPTASTSKGGVAVNGNGLVMSGDTIQIDNTVVAETTEHHLVQYDANGLVTGGRVINAGDIPVATSTTVGTVKPGSGLGVDGTGDLSHSNSVVAGTATKFTFDTEGHVTATESLLDTDIPDLDAAKVTTGEFPTARIANAAVTAEKLADRSTATIAELTPTNGAFIGQTHLNSITGDYFLWDGNVWQPIGISVGEIVLAGTYDASTNLIDTVTSEGTALGFTVGQALPAPSSANSGYYVVVSLAGTGSPPAPTVQLNPPDFLLSNGSVWTEIDVSDTVVAQQAQNVAFTPAGDIQSTNVQGAIEELDTEKAPIASPVFTGNVTLDTAGTLIFEGATDNAFETTLTVADPTADQTLTLPDVTGTIVTTGDTGSVTSAMIVDGTIVDADVSAAADIAVDKLAPGTARQLLQTNVAGNGVQFTSNVDVPGTLDVTGATTLDSSLTVTGLISADGKISFPAGTAALPSIYFSTDTNTGLYQSAADEVSISTAGTQRVVVDATGNVGIGTSSPQTTLEVASNDPKIRLNDLDGSVRADLVGSGGNFGYYANGGGAHIWYGSADVERMRIDSAGNVGIGTSSPAASLELNQSGLNPTIQVNRPDAATAGAVQLACGNNVNYIQSIGDKDFQIATNSVEKFRITSTGNVGIGTSSPASRLEVSRLGSAWTGVAPETGAGLFIHNGNNATTSPASIQLGAGSASASNIFFGDEFDSNIGQLAYYHTDNSMRFNINNAERMRIDSAGNVGIGTSSPTAKLQIQGDTTDVLRLDRGVQNAVSYLNINADRTSAGSYLGGVRFEWDGTEVAGVKARAGSDTTNKDDGHLVFETAEAGTANERMRIDSAGNVGIGTSTPGGVLSIGPSDSQQQILYGDGTGASYFRSTTDVNRASADQAIHLQDFKWNGTTVANIRAYTGSDTVNKDDGYLTFGTSAAGGASERMRIDSSGNVGIGEASPAATLDVNGAYASNITAVAALDLDLSTANYFTKTIAANSTFTFSSPAASRAVSFTLELTHTSGTVTWPTSVKWPGDVAPTLTTGKTHLFMFVTDDGGTTYRGASLVDYTN